jgi:RNA polymerase sigma factor (sigma-70 family)
MGEMHSALIAIDDIAIQRAKSGDMDALERVFRAYQSTVYNTARRICRTAEDSEDVLQETFLEVCRSIASLRGDGVPSLTSWIRRIAASKALMKIRREKYRETDEFDEEFQGYTRDSDAALRMDLETAMTKLGDTSRAVVWLHDVEGYTHEDIGEMMGKSVSFSKSQLARAHKRLRVWLNGEATC